MKLILNNKLILGFCLKTWNHMGQIGHLSNSSQVSYSYLNSLKCTQISGRQMQELESLPYMSFWSNNSVNLSHFSPMFSHEKPRYQIKPCCWSRSYTVFKCLHEDVALNVVQKYFIRKWTIIDSKLAEELLLIWASWAIGLFLWG